ncbi:MAG: amidohydrolase family protein [Pirellulales bacterium]
MPRPIALRARLVFPVAAPPMVDGCVTIAGQRIVAVGRAAPDADIRDLGNVAILPGLVNAHTHLEFADLAAPLGVPGMTLPAWIRQVMSHRRVASPSAGESVLPGLNECVRTGTTTVGDIATQDWRAIAAATACPLPDVVMFREAIGPTPDRIAPAIAASEAFLASPNPLPNVLPALSPHAPYTVHPALLDSLVDLALRHHVPLAMHLAESREELELLRAGTGPIRELLVELNAWNDAADARYGSILAYLEALARAPRALVIHGNYLSESEQAFLAAHAASMSVVYCPRTHAYFGHDPYPLAAMLARGVPVALGTDSRASNPDLDLWTEMRFVAERHPQVSPATVLELGTWNGARALGVDREVGTLAAGKLANLAIVAIDDAGGDPHERLFDRASRVVETYLRGEPTRSPTVGSW